MTALLIFVIVVYKDYKRIRQASLNARSWASVYNQVKQIHWQRHVLKESLGVKTISLISNFKIELCLR